MMLITRSQRYNSDGILVRRVTSHGRRFSIERLPEDKGGWYYSVAFGNRRLLYFDSLKRAKRAARLMGRLVWNVRLVS